MRTNATRGFISFDVNFSGDTLQIDLADNNGGQWIFVDEVRFVNVPEPATLSLFAFGGLALLRRPRRNTPIP